MLPLDDTAIDNRIADPAYCPYCLNCSGIDRMVQESPWFWTHRCGARVDMRPYATWSIRVRDWTNQSIGVEMLSLPPSYSKDNVTRVIEGMGRALKKDYTATATRLGYREAVESTGI